MLEALLLYGVTVAVLLRLALLLHGIGHLGLGDRVTRAPGLDVVVFVLTVLPQLVALVWGNLAGFGFWGTLGLIAVAVAGQLTAMELWIIGHELANRDAVHGPRIVKTMNRAVGRLRNHAAVWWTAWAVPLFWLVRMAQWLVYPPLTWWVRLPKYDHAEWVNVSRQKFDGLVGWDLIWCLYCDWMTGVWSLGSEMLRNVESFWCPIRFRSDKKCDNCKIDFPDVDGSWAPADGTMQQVVEVLADNYPGPEDDRGKPVNAWHGHRVRLTVNGEDFGTPI
jgi:hypothetical protein